MCAGQHFSTLRLTPPLVSERGAREWQASSLPHRTGVPRRVRPRSQARDHPRCDPEAGLLPDFGALAGERTVRYGLEVWSEWSRVLRYPPRTLIYLVSRNIQQLNLPTSSSAVDAGMSSELVRLVDPATRATPYTGWLRRSVATGAVIYAGFYTTCGLPGREGRFVKVVFPLPDGSATVVLRPENRPDGSFALVSAGDDFGDAGYYRVPRAPRARSGRSTCRSKK